MSKNRFTEEEIAILEANPYTYSVSPKQITYTREFKQLFWSDYQNRMQPSEIFQKYGYDPSIIGRARVTGFQQTIKKEAEEGLGFRDGKRSPGLRKEAENINEPYSKTIRDMQQRIDYMEQEIYFLKKISSAKTTRK